MASSPHLSFVLQADPKDCQYDNLHVKHRVLGRLKQQSNEAAVG